MDCGRLSAAYLDMERPTPLLYPYFNNEFKILINHNYDLVCADNVHYVLFKIMLHMSMIYQYIDHFFLM